MKEPRVQKSKEQILADLKKNVEFQRRMKFTREVFYPALNNASQNIDDALTLLSGFNNIVMQEFLGLMREKKISDLQLDAKLDKDSPKYTENQVLLAHFQDMSVFEAKEYIEGMREEINLFLSEENKARPLSDLKTKWIDEI